MIRKIADLLSRSHQLVPQEYRNNYYAMPEEWEPLARRIVEAMADEEGSRVKAALEETLQNLDGLEEDLRTIRRRVTEHLDALSQETTP